MQLLGSLCRARPVRAVHHKHHAVHIGKVLRPHAADAAAAAQVVKDHPPAKHELAHGRREAHGGHYEGVIVAVDGARERGLAAVVQALAQGAGWGGAAGGVGHGKRGLKNGSVGQGAESVRQRRPRTMTRITTSLAGTLAQQPILRDGIMRWSVEEKNARLIARTLWDKNTHLFVFVLTTRTIPTSKLGLVVVTVLRGVRHSELLLCSRRHADPLCS